MTVFAIGGDDPVAIGQHRDDPGGDRLFPVIEMQEAADLLLRVKLGAFVLELADADHVSEQVQHMGPVEARFVDHGHVSSVSSVEMSPFGQAKLARLQKAAHDLARAGLGQGLAEHDLARGDGGAELLARMAADGPFQVLGPARTRGSA
jgi:hypothetical protein